MTISHEILGVEESATADEIKAAFRKLALKYHPDKNTAPEANDKFIQIHEAYEDLTIDKEMLKKQRVEPTVEAQAEARHVRIWKSMTGLLGDSFTFKDYMNLINRPVKKVLKEIEELKRWHENPTAEEPALTAPRSCKSCELLMGAEKLDRFDRKSRPVISPEGQYCSLEFPTAFDTVKNSLKPIGRCLKTRRWEDAKFYRNAQKLTGVSLGKKYRDTSRISVQND